MTSWPEAVQYLLRLYGTPQAISEVRSKLKTMKQGNARYVSDYGGTVNEEFMRCGGVYNMQYRISICIDGLMAATQTLVSRFRKATKKATYLDIIQFTSDEGKAYRARYPQAAKDALVTRSRAMLLRRSKRSVLSEQREEARG